MMFTAPIGLKKMADRQLGDAEAGSAMLKVHNSVVVPVHWVS